MDKDDRIGAVDNLLASHKEKGFPLIEQDSLLEGYVYATFIHIDSTHQNDITFNVFGIYDEYRFGDKKLYHLDSTDLYYRTYMIPDDLCFAYKFYYSNKVTGKKSRMSDPLNPSLVPSSERKNMSWSALDLRTSEDEWYVKSDHRQYGTLDTLELHSELLSNARNIYVYLPPKYDTTKEKYPVIYLFDPYIYLNLVEVPNVLDNLIYHQEISPMIAVFIDNPSQAVRNKELPLNAQFKNFFITELLPFIKDRYHVTDLADETIIGGISYGGLAATYIAFEHSDVFGKVLSQSGSFWRDTTLTDGGEDWIRGDHLTRQFQTQEKRSLKLHLDWGLQENWCKASGRRLAQVLKDKQYEFTFTEFNGWHDWSNSRKIFPDALRYLLE
ncbi:alpha/beta hydrolase [Tunicatimonas pelagia]|uniref:alpha/beta hydrolase n=1 Tax=Tunicatimonas pelagia TaxID=931531 RepID=UPI0026655C8C|nr:alpha/beta hydrolase-fold protein [Tunicatimonas pelagia]WKN45655.1 alpha/beta hydrolase-fold protein [Tunicatimonas pelagia]